jgi:hypothetical protein
MLPLARAISWLFHIPQQQQQQDGNHIPPKLRSQILVIQAPIIRVVINGGEEASSSQEDDAVITPIQVEMLALAESLSSSQESSSNPWYQLLDWAGDTFFAWV